MQPMKAEDPAGVVISPPGRTATGKAGWVSVSPRRVRYLQGMKSSQGVGLYGTVIIYQPIRIH